MAQIGPSIRRGSIGPSQTPSVGYSNLYAVIQSPWGPDNVWKICSSFASFVRQFGGLSKLVTLAADGSADTYGNETNANVIAGFYAVKGYFENKGNNNNGVAFICRGIQVSSPPTAATRNFNDGGANNTTITAKSKGFPGSAISVLIGASPNGAAYKRITIGFVPTGATEVYDISNAADAADASIKSELVTITLPAGGQLPSNVTTPAKLGNTPGTAGTADAYAAADADLIGTTAASGARTGLQQFNEARLGTGFVVIPGKFTATIRSGLKTHSDNFSRTVLYGTPSGLTQSTVIDGVTTGNLLNLTGDYIAGYWPQVRVSDLNSTSSGTLLVDPVGHIAGLGARMDAEYAGPHKAIAGTTHELRGVLDIERNSSGQELCDDAGSNNLADSFVNTIRLKGSPAGICVWGNRSFSTDGRYRQLSQGRVIQVIILTGYLIAEPLTHEPIDSDGRLFAKAEQNIKAFLKELWRHGALFGSEPGDEPKPTDGYAVICNRGNNTDTTLAQNALVIDVMAVPAPNAESVQLTIFAVAPGAVPTTAPR